MSLLVLRGVQPHRLPIHLARGPCLHQDILQTMEGPHPMDILADLPTKCLLDPKGLPPGPRVNHTHLWGMHRK
ncbi:hypothetical protein BIW11_11098, partial [Tropilaelaps mercedesae]